MQYTKNNLSFNKVELDFEAMLQTARIALGNTLQEIHRHWEDMMRVPHKGSDALNAMWLEEETHMLVIVAETLETLEGARERHQLEVVNKPEIKRG